MKYFSKEEDDFLRKNRNKIPTKRMSKMLGRSESSARQRMKLLGCMPDKEFTEKFKKESQIKKGATPLNKGKRQSEFMTASAIEKTKATRFRKGNIPQNHKPVEYKRITVDGYIEVKVCEPNKFDLLHRHIYKKHFGFIPDGMIVKFKDGDSKNCSIENLYLSSREENMKANTIHNYPTPIIGIIKLRAKLNRKIKKYSK